MRDYEMYYKQIWCLLISSVSHVFPIRISFWSDEAQPISTLVLLQSSLCSSCCCWCCSPPYWWWWWWWCCCWCCRCCSYNSFSEISSCQVLFLVILEECLSLRRCRRNEVLDALNGVNPKITYRPGLGHLLWRNEEPIQLRNESHGNIHT